MDITAVPVVVVAVSAVVRAEVPAVREAPAASAEEDHPWEAHGPIWAAVGDTDHHPLGAEAAAAAACFRLSES